MQRKDCYITDDLVCALPSTTNERAVLRGNASSINFIFLSKTKRNSQIHEKNSFGYSMCVVYIDLYNSSETTMNVTIGLAESMTLGRPFPSSPCPCCDDVSCFSNSSVGASCGASCVSCRSSSCHRAPSPKALRLLFQSSTRALVALSTAKAGPPLARAALSSMMTM